VILVTRADQSAWRRCIIPEHRENDNGSCRKISEPGHLPGGRLPKSEAGFERVLRSRCRAAYWRILAGRRAATARISLPRLRHSATPSPHHWWLAWLFRPSGHAMKRYLDAGDVAVIREVELRRIETDHPIRESHHAHEQPRHLLEKQFQLKFVRGEALGHPNVHIIDTSLGDPLYDAMLRKLPGTRASMPSIPPERPSKTERYRPGGRARSSSSAQAP
jgi:hypothetical protein